ncbi:replication factor A protein 3 [Pholiota conissans]|uniref:Replication factor A protein 3 n=1 Tax=Pholiota conissans TaxID=109636 RepID=A0A9P6CTS8_9AGAR|nr:replication factor A protein 3 [Pholiota conissans]
MADEDREHTPRVNSARLADFIGKTIRLPCKVLKVDGERLTVEAADGGQVAVNATPNADVSDTFIEVIGKVNSPSSIQMLASISMGSDLDMKLVNDTIELIHDRRFYNRMF